MFETSCLGDDCLLFFTAQREQRATVAALGIYSGEIGCPHFNYIKAMTALTLGTSSRPPKTALANYSVGRLKIRHNENSVGATVRIDHYYHG